MGCRLVQAATLAAFIHIVFTSEVIAQDPTDLNKDDVPGRMLTLVPTDFVIGASDYKISVSDYIISAGDFIISASDYKIVLVNWVLDLLQHGKKVSCQEKQLVHLMT